MQKFFSTTGDVVPEMSAKPQPPSSSLGGDIHNLKPLLPSEDDKSNLSMPKLQPVGLERYILPARV